MAMKAAKDRKEEFCDPAREEDISKRNKTSKIQLLRWTNALSVWKFSIEAECWLEAFVESRLK